MRLVTMADDGYAPGLATLVQSLVETGGLGPFPLTVVQHRPLRADIKAALAETGVAIDYLDLDDLGSVAPKDHTPGVRRTTLQKLLLFGLPYRERVAFVDSDMLCVGPLTGIEDLEPFSAAPDLSPKELPPVAGRQVFNSGFFVFEPDEQRAAELVDFYLSSDRRFVLGDQMVLNEFLYTRHPDEVHLIDPSWNTIKRRVAADAGRDLTGVRLLHYTSRKPWKRLWHPEGEHGAALLHMDRLWWDCYLRSPVAPVLGLRRPRFAALRISHAAAVWPLWNAAHWIRLRTGGGEDELAAVGPSGSELGTTA